MAMARDTGAERQRAFSVLSEMRVSDSNPERGYSSALTDQEPLIQSFIDGSGSNPSNLHPAQEIRSPKISPSEMREHQRLNMRLRNSMSQMNTGVRERGNGKQGEIQVCNIHLRSRYICVSKTA